jgi:predicted GH43/DUF377 family glycosyl hydrolase
MQKGYTLFRSGVIAGMIAATTFTFVYAQRVTGDTKGETAFPYRWVLSRYPGNPVLRAIPGTWEAEWFSVDSVIRRKDRLYLYYHGSDKGNRNTQLGLAFSSDGITWTRDPDNPVWKNAWHFGLRDVRVYQLGESDFWLYYSDFDEHIDLAHSTDGIHWKNFDRNPVLAPSQDWESLLMQECVLRLGEQWYMWYSTYEGKPRVTGLATSNDGIHWTKYARNPVLRLGEPGQWDDYSAFQPTVLFQDGSFHMLYTGSSKKNPTGYQWGYALSKDGVRWTKSPENPIFTPGPSGNWDAGKVSGHPIVRTGPDSFYIYYGGASSPDDTYRGIGLVEARLVRP